MNTIRAKEREEVVRIELAGFFAGIVDRSDLPDTFIPASISD
jgi:hypothetical protein